MGAGLLGIPTALLAHIGAFGGSGHTVGGAFHEAFMEGSLAAVAAFGLLLVASLLQSVNRSADPVRDGSVLAMRLHAYLPNVLTLVAGSAFWYGIIEALEPHHDAAPLVLLLIAFFAAATFVHFVASAIVRVLASIAIVFSTSTFATHTARFRPRRYHAIVLTAGRIASRRLFARPPPLE